MNNNIKLVLSHRPERALRLRRQLMAIYSYLLLWAGTVVGVEIAAFDPRTPHLLIFGSLFAANLVVFALVRSGFTERFKDPSLTMVQMFAGIVVITLLLYYARELRGALLSLYLIMMTFGVFSLDRRQQIVMAASAQLSFTVLLVYEWVQLPLTQILALS
ncbi:MAG TPA: GGDEF domain-containing protein, partial [Alcanivorax sp.]|nr:GGDEF domain-containing protein [Alcanivorax sp.]